jgi:F0F1-type ATP synthase membrane subunit c/vacuolar-type H+-ATPase subunit K
VQPLPPASSRSARLVLIAAGLLVLLGMVAFATRGGFGHHSSHAAPSRRYADFAFSTFMILFVLATPVAAYAFLLRARERAANPRGFAVRVMSSLVIVFVFALASVVVLVARKHHWHLFHGTNPIANLRNAFAAKSAQHGSPSYEPHFEWTVLWVALTVGVVGLAAAIVQRRRRPPRQLDETTVAEDVALTIGDAIDDLEAEPDARRAVIAAYARMEGVLGRHGLRRKPSETPVEYLRRVLLGLTSSRDAVVRLTALLEQAKFSSHAVDGGMKSEAIGALREIREGLL